MKASVTVGGRTFSEILDEKEEREYFDESSRPDNGITWEHYTRPIEKVDETGLEKLNGNHILFGWIESLFQSDMTPYMSLTYMNEDKEWSYSFE